MNEFTKLDPAKELRFAADEIDRLTATNAALLAACEVYLHLIDRPAPNTGQIWDELVTKPMRDAIALAKGEKGEK